MKRMIKWLVWIPVILMMITIFGFSNANSEKSSSLSGSFIYDTLNFVDGTFSLQLDQQEKNRLVEALQTPIRKMAHMTEYMVLAITLMFALYVDGLKNKKMVAIAALIGIAYAALDEFHQLFVPGRSGEIRDVCVDTIGILIGIGIFLLLLKLYNYISYKRKKVGRI